jgi:hypothetical protein
VRPMKKTAFLLALFALAALPAAAQHNEFGFLLGATKPMKSDAGKGSFESGLREFYYGMQFEQNTMFRLEVGRMKTKTAFPDGAGGFDIDDDGTVEHASGVIEYRFHEPYGYTGLFAGAGLYRQKTNDRSESDYGFQVGVDTLFPINRTYAVIVKGAYHWVNITAPRARYVTVGAGIRLAF